MTSESQLNLLVEAIAAPESVARNLWNGLMSKVKFDELDSRVFNLLPSLYTKIGKIDGVLEIKRLRGVYLYNASINLRREAQIRNLIKHLDMKEIDYRILKGMAISLLSGNIGMRSMGDVDLLIDKQDYIKFVEVSREVGLRQLFDVGCQRKRSKTLDNKINFVSQDNLEIDIHFSNLSFPSRTLHSMMLEKPYLVNRNGQQFKIPLPRLLAKHLCIHGIQRVGVVDKFRTYVDLNLLETKFAEIDSGNSRILATNYVNLVSTNNNSDQKILFTRQARLIFIIEKIRQIQRLGAKIRFRRIDFLSTNLSLRRHFSFVYFIWIFGARLQVIERIISKLRLGFLKVPPKQFPIGQNISVCNNLKIDTPIYNSLVNPFEVRIKVKTDKEFSKHDIHFFSDEFKLYDYEIFCNGKMVGKNIANKLGSLGVSVFSATDSIEISIRNPIHSCFKCQKDFRTLTMRLENGKRFTNDQ